MTFLPVVSREMSALARRNATYAVRTGIAFGAVVILAWLLVSSTAMNTAAQGKTVFVLLSGIAFVYALLAGVHTTSDSLSEEKREGTLGLLFLTDLRGYDIVLGKMAATSLNAAFALFAIVPVMSLAVFLGGVTAGQLAMMALVLVVSLFLSLSIGVIVSSISKNERKAMFATMVGMLVLVFGPFLAGLGLTNFNRAIEELAVISPLYSYSCVFGATAAGLDPSYFWMALGVQATLGAGCLILAARILPRFVNELPPARFQAWRALLDRLVFGEREGRKRHRAALLDRNAFLWLASRERYKTRYAWLIIGVFAGLYAWIYYQFPDMFFELPVSMTILFLIHFAFKLWTASEVASRLIQDRRSGALELLLSTPLTVREIARGQTTALRRIFFWPVTVLMAAEIALFYGTLTYLPRTVSKEDAIVCFFAVGTMLLIDLWALTWTGMWLSLRGKSIERVLMGTAGRILALPWCLLALAVPIMIGSRIITGRVLRSDQVIGVWWLIGVVVALVFAIPARRKFLRTFREAAVQRFDAPVESLSPEVKALAPDLALPKRRKRYRIRLAWACVLGLLILGPTLRRAHWEHRMNQEIARIEREGLPTGFQNLGIYYPPVSANENALAVVKAAGTVNFGAFGRRINPLGNFGMDGVAPISTETREKLERTVALNQQQLAAYRRAAQMSKAYLEPEIEPVWTFWNDLQNIILVAAMETSLAIEQGDEPGSVNGLVDLLKFAALLRQQPAPQAQSACLTALDRAQYLMERLFFRAVLDAEALRQIDAQLSRSDVLPVLARTLAVRRALVLTRLRSGVQDPFAPPNPAYAMISGLMTGIGNHHRGVWRLLAAYRSGIQLAERPSWERLDLAITLNREATSGLQAVPPYLMRAYEMLGTVELDTALSTRMLLLRIALAAEGYRLEHGRLPEKLADLDTQPFDPYTGEAFKVSNRESGFVVYSVGQNRVDEAGNTHQGADVAFSLWVRPDGKSR